MMLLWDIIGEIEDVGSQSFPISDPKRLLAHAKPFATMDEYEIFKYTQEEDHYLIVAKDGQVANYTAFMEINPHKWMSRRSQTYERFKGNKLTARVLQLLKSKGFSLQSDIQQSPDGFKVWDKHLPALGLKPMILDRSDGKIYDKSDIDPADLFTKNPKMYHRYCFVMESSDYYPAINLAHDQFTGFRNLWFGEYNVLTEDAKLTQRPKVFIDLDGVCADFFAGYRKLNPSVKSEDEMPDGPDHTYDMMKGTDFFYRLPKYSSTDQLIATVLDFVPSYRILSAPLHGDYANCKRQKTRWVEQFLAPAPKKVFITSKKYRHAVDPNSGIPNILIDDKTKNLRPWQEAGGIAIKYFAPDDSVDKVRTALEEIFGR